MEAAAHGGEAPGDRPDATAGDTSPPPESPLGAHAAGGEREHDLFAERPEAFVGAAFVGGLLLARIVRRLGR